MDITMVFGTIVVGSNPAGSAKYKQLRAVYVLCARASDINHSRTGFEALLPYLRVILITSKWEGGTDRVTVEKCTHGPTGSAN